MSRRLRNVTVTTIDKPPLQENLTESDAQARAALLSDLSSEVSLLLSDDPEAETFQSATASSSTPRTRDRRPSSTSRRGRSTNAR
jgi:hypothetical protein